jgi:hypothetical protein
MMTSQQARACLLDKIGPEWPKCKAVPTKLKVALCEAIWREGGSPTIARTSSLLGVSYRAVQPGVMAWHRRLDTSPFVLQTPASQQQNLDYLIKIVSPAVASAPVRVWIPFIPGGGRFPVARFWPIWHKFATGRYEIP